MLCWNSWVLFGRFVSLESLVHCCLLESLGFQRQGSSLENKSKHVTAFFSLVVAAGWGNLEFLSCLT